MVNNWRPVTVQPTETSVPTITGGDAIMKDLGTELDKIEEMLTKMEGHCDAKQFQDAMVVHKDIKSLIEQR